MKTLQTQQRSIVAQPFKANKQTPSRSVVLTRCIAQQQSGMQRREALIALTAITPALLSNTPAAFAAEGRPPKGFVPVKDNQDGYSFLYPFGWQEVGVDGQDIVYKDVIEPLESVSVALVPTERKTIDDFGEVKSVCQTLADKVLTSPSQEVQLIKAEERTTDGRKYYDFEFTVKNNAYARHAGASVTVGNGQFYTLVTGSNERRWGKMADKVNTIVKSFTVVDRY